MILSSETWHEIKRNGWHHWIMLAVEKLAPLEEIRLSCWIIRQQGRRQTWWVGWAPLPAPAGPARSVTLTPRGRNIEESTTHYRTSGLHRLYPLQKPHPRVFYFLFFQRPIIVIGLSGRVWVFRRSRRPAMLTVDVLAKRRLWQWLGSN